jgi:hypothetical protein
MALSAEYSLDVLLILIKKPETPPNLAVGVFRAVTHERETEGCCVASGLGCRMKSL